MDEQWKEIPGFPGYEASTLGSIRSWLKQGNYLKKIATEPRLLKQVYRGRPGRKRLSVNLCRDGKTYPRQTHCLVLETFIGPRPEDMEACHGDSDKDNNRLDNLRWDTRLANEQDKIRHGHSGKGEQNTQSKLTVQQVLEIRRRYAVGESCLVLGRSYGVRSGTITKIVTGQRWKHIGGPVHRPGEHCGQRSPSGIDTWFGQHPKAALGSSNGNAILTEQDVRNIRHRASQGEKVPALAQEYCVCKANIYHILSRRAWKHVD